MSNTLILSPLGHTWIFDIDGTLVKHNGYLLDGVDTLLPGVQAFFASLQPEDCVILVTSRKENMARQTERFLSKNGIRYNHIIYGVPYGERILVNDRKPSGLETCLSCSFTRNQFQLSYQIDKEK